MREIYCSTCNNYVASHLHNCTRSNSAFPRKEKNVMTVEKTSYMIGDVLPPTTHDCPKCHNEGVLLCPHFQEEIDQIYSSVEEEMMAELAIKEDEHMQYCIICNAITYHDLITGDCHLCCNKEAQEFPVYRDAQGNEHQEY